MSRVSQAEKKGMCPEKTGLLSVRSSQFTSLCSQAGSSKGNLGEYRGTPQGQCEVPYSQQCTCVCFEGHQDEFTVLPWPANSLDLNPITDHLDRVVPVMDPQSPNLAQSRHGSTSR
ncbi:hypothetical protein TNCV_1106561 [Trichonephila clavipes]|nr:hypothetical protein TNCV_1106561 [Trichonephila clavipes]